MSKKTAEEIVGKILLGGEYGDEERASAIEIGMRGHASGAIKSAANKKNTVLEGVFGVIGSVGKALPMIALTGPIAAGIAGDFTGRAHHNLESTAKRNSNSTLKRTKQRLALLNELAESRGGYAIPNEDEKGGPSMGSQSSPSAGTREPSPAPPDNAKDRKTVSGGDFAELVD